MGEMRLAEIMKDLLGRREAWDGAVENNSMKNTSLGIEMPISRQTRCEGNL